MKLELTITMDQNSAVTVSGPIGNKAVCYTMLELAKDAIREHCVKNERLVQPVGMMPHVGGGNGA